MQAKNRAVIVDENDNIIGYKYRADWLPNDIKRVTGLWITNGKGDVLLAQRAFSKDRDPGRWGPAVAGTVDEGETYDSNIIKEAEEEIGLKNIKPVKGPKRFTIGSHKYFLQMYSLVADKPIEDFAFPEDEVNALKWVNIEELKEKVVSHPDQFVLSMPAWIKEFSN